MLIHRPRKRSYRWSMICYDWNWSRIKKRYNHSDLSVRSHMKIMGKLVWTSFFSTRNKLVFSRRTLNIRLQWKTVSHSMKSLTSNLFFALLKRLQFYSIFCPKSDSFSESEKTKMILIMTHGDICRHRPTSTNVISAINMVTTSPIVPWLGLNWCEP